MTTKHLDKRTKPAILDRNELIPLRGSSGKLYGYLDPQRRVIEIKAARGGNGRTVIETIDLAPYLDNP
jgi:hypothetical protein